MHAKTKTDVKASGKKRARKNGRPDKKVLADIIRRVVRAARPEKIVLFGSAARGQMGPNSDVDLLVIKGGKFDRGRIVERIYSHLHGAGEAVDVIVVTPEEVERYRETHCLVICPALREGQVVYAA
ncbi:MAG: nucleotidyltransferase domain-containing protein [Planctomycetia bacterium]|nr:nucleotidyltransferase domain-containing protein [Planctomycetia bacterium]